MEQRLSAIVCTFNPRRDYLGRALKALQGQSLPTADWELLVVDNASVAPVSAGFDISWHPNGRHIREEVLGLTSARLRGIAESKGQILVFVDDDNVLASDYLENCLRISANYPFLGAWGGSIVGEFESETPEWARPLLPKLAIREVATDRWSNSTENLDTLPCGAGMCVRRDVALSYAGRIQRDPIRMQLDRRGLDLSSGGDTDLAWTACDMGKGTGLFTDLRVVHLIPASRLREDYLLRLTESMAYSSVLLNHSRNRNFVVRNRSKLRRMLGILRRHLTMKFRTRRFFEAKLHGQERALAEITNGKNTSLKEPKKTRGKTLSSCFPGLL